METPPAPAASTPAESHPTCTNPTPPRRDPRQDRLPPNCLDLTASSGAATPCPSTPCSASAAGNSQLFQRGRSTFGPFGTQPASNGSNASRPSISSTRPSSAAFQPPGSGGSLAGALRPSHLLHFEGTPPATSVSAPAAMQSDANHSDDPLERLQQLRGNLPAFGRRSSSGGFGGSHLSTLSALGAAHRGEALESPRDAEEARAARAARAAEVAAAAARKLQRSINLSDAYGTPLVPAQGTPARPSRNGTPGVVRPRSGAPSRAGRGLREALRMVEADW